MTSLRLPSAASNASAPPTGWRTRSCATAACPCGKPSGRYTARHLRQLLAGGCRFRPAPFVWKVRRRPGGLATDRRRNRRRRRSQRRPEEELLASWNAQGGPFKDALNNAPKYVASTTLKEPLPWSNSTLLGGDLVDALRALKAQSGGVLAIMGSGVPIGSLMAANLIGEYLLMIHPLVLGTGRRLFPGGVQISLRLTDSRTTATGVVIATYEQASD